MTGSRSTLAFNVSDSLSAEAQSFIGESIYLPIIDSLLEEAQKQRFTHTLLKKAAIVYIHHPLKTSVNLVEAMISLGVVPSNIFVLGKHYSESLPIVDKIKKLGVYYEPCSPQLSLGSFSQCFIQDIDALWARVIANLNDDIEAILIADHGGYALSRAPHWINEKYNVIGLEKTTGGLINFETWGIPPFPIIDVARCATKKILESPLIADAVVTKLIPFLPYNYSAFTYGVVGCGAIGKAVSTKLLSMGCQVMLYDKDLVQSDHQIKGISNNINITRNLSSLIKYSDYVLGCTGRDITGSVDCFETLSKDKTFISCSSGDVEFLSLLKRIQRQYDNQHISKHPLDEICYHTKQGATIHVLRGGFPINFDHSGESVPSNDIQLTRALVLGGILQCTQYLKNSDVLGREGIYALDANIQHFIVDEWLKYQPSGRFSESILKNFQHTTWIAEHSNGIKK